MDHLRPVSALARGVHITQLTESRVNPEPVTLEETDVLLEEYLSPRRLRALTGVENLEEVHYLEMKVDTTETSLGNFGSMLPNLSQLKLSNSIITTVRDLGSCFSSLKVLWMARCGLEDLDGLSAMSNLHELYLAYNEISDISPCSMLDKIEILDLEGNNIDDISQVEFLALCTNLSNLTLEGNPICLCPSSDKTGVGYDYRQAVKKSVSTLKYLDDEPLDNCLKPQAVFEKDWQLIHELMKDTGFSSGDSLSANSGSTERPKSGFCPSGYRPGSALRPQTSKLRGSNRPNTGAVRLDVDITPASGESFETQEDSSDLTVGVVVCGNPSKALRTRRNLVEKRPAMLFAQYQHHPEHTYDESIDDQELGELVSELKEWKAMHEYRKKKIEEQRLPQVLHIDLDNNLSEDSSDDQFSAEEDSNVQKCVVNKVMDDNINTIRNLCIEEQTLNSTISEKNASNMPGMLSMKYSAREHIRSESESRPVSGPVVGSKLKFRLEPNVDKSRTKVIDTSKPVIRTALKSPEKLLNPGPRAVTAKAVIIQSTTRNKKRHLPKVGDISSGHVSPE